MGLTLELLTTFEEGKGFTFPLSDTEGAVSEFLVVNGGRDKGLGFTFRLAVTALSTLAVSDATPALTALDWLTVD